MRKKPKSKDAAYALFVSGADSATMPTTEIAGTDLTDGAISIIDLLVATGLTKSKSEARRLVQQGGVSVDDVKVASVDTLVTAEQLQAGGKLRKGKKTYHKAILQ